VVLRWSVNEYWGWTLSTIGLVKSAESLALLVRILSLLRRVFDVRGKKTIAKAKR
jgi:hypothetical protein